VAQSVLPRQAGAGGQARLRTGGSLASLPSSTPRWFTSIAARSNGPHRRLLRRKCCGLHNAFPPSLSLVSCWVQHFLRKAPLRRHRLST